MKLPKGVSQEFYDSIQAMPTDELKSTIVKLQVNNQENEEFKLSPQFISELELIEEARARFNLIAGPVKDASIAIKNMTKLVVERLKEKGTAE